MEVIMEEEEILKILLQDPETQEIVSEEEKEAFEAWLGV